MIEGCGTNTRSEITLCDFLRWAVHGYGGSWLLFTGLKWLLSTLLHGGSHLITIILFLLKGKGTTRPAFVERETKSDDHRPEPATNRKYTDIYTSRKVLISGIWLVALPYNSTPLVVGKILTEFVNSRTPLVSSISGVW